MLVTARFAKYISPLLLWLSVYSCSSSPRQEEQLPYFNTADFSPLFIKNEAAVKDSISHQIRSFSFIDQDSNLITDQDISGKIHIANFIFTSCGSICPRITENIKTLSTAFEQDSNIVILSFSVTPWIDSVPRLKAYKEAKGIHNPYWHFLTGNKADIYQLARQSYFAEEDLGFSRDSSDFLHSEHILLVDPSKRIRGVYNGTLALDIKQLIQDIRLLKRSSASLDPQP